MCRIFCKYPCVFPMYNVNFIHMYILMHMYTTKQSLMNIHWTECSGTTEGGGTTLHCTFPSPTHFRIQK